LYSPDSRGKIPALNCWKYRGAPYAFFKTKPIQERLLAEIPYRPEGCNCPEISSDAGKQLLELNATALTKSIWINYFLPQIRGNSGSSPKEENVFAANCDMQKNNPALKLSTGEKNKDK